MKTKIYVDNEQFIAGTTLKDDMELEQNNMALHICDNVQAIIDNRQHLAATLNCDLQHFICTEQTHSANFHKVTLADKGRGAEQIDTAVKNTDALYTIEPNLLLCSFTADCVPVIFYNAVNGLVGVIHSGWQGTVKEITPKLFEHLMNEEQCQPEDFHVQIGMALSQQKFEVDADVYEKFHSLGYAEDFMYYNAETNKYHIDNQQTVKKQCELAGIPADQIQIDETCTFLSPNGFSYRQDKQAGRHLSFIMRKTS
ncbi:MULTISPECIES: peptidoglycan editing factor PgeF [unclassified Lysinibacillus]|uniref:peptidoglycan editing factor PgeF n=1 Tax=unclassified Lysinibacillus TaxID=2636778 RepID=UPI000738C817|nr:MULTISPECIES: peptidoglycan editing factor PgeF [unclassified Lysinibacillus]KUF31758.1 Laccase [Lysinibacillus sp. F5]